MSLLNREDESFSQFFRKYWWIEFLVVAKVLIFVTRGSYDMSVGFLVLLGGLFLLWLLYRLGLE